MIKSIGTSGCIIELMRVAGEIKLAKEDYRIEDIELLRQDAHFNRTYLRSRTKTYGLIDNNYVGAIAEIKTINAIKKIENLEGMLFNNVKVDKTQIDHVLVGEYGVVVIDSKMRKEIDVEKIKEQMKNQVDVLARYISSQIGFYKKTMKAFAVIYSKQKLPDNVMFLSDASKIAEHLQENVLDEEKTERIQKHILKATVHPKISVEVDLWGNIYREVKL